MKSLYECDVQIRLENRRRFVSEHATKANDGVDVCLHSLLTAALDG
jgi:hypothetical protein